MTETNMSVHLAARPKGAVSLTDFKIQQGAIPNIGKDQVLFRNRFLSIDPYMRVRMDEGESYAANLEIGDLMVGDGVGEVVQSFHSDWKVGDLAVGRFGWQRFACSDGTALRRIQIAKDKPSAHLGILGMPGVTGWYGLQVIGQPKEGETVVVGSASGAVGSVVGQIAKMKGCRVVGIAGGEKKCKYVVDELGFDECIDYRSDDFDDQLSRAAPDGIDVYFDTVGGKILDAVLERCNTSARIPLCGMIAGYNTADQIGVTKLYSAIANRVMLQGFIVSDHIALWPQAIAELDAWVREGKIKYHETIAEGLEAAPSALIGLLTGRNFGKQLVKID